MTTNNINKIPTSTEILELLNATLKVFNIDEDEKTVTVQPHKMSAVFDRMTPEFVNYVNNNRFLNFEGNKSKYSTCISKNRACELLRFYIDCLLSAFDEEFLKNYSFILLLPQVFKEHMEYLSTIPNIFRCGNSEFQIGYRCEGNIAVIVKYFGDAITPITWELNGFDLFLNEENN